MKVLIEIDEGSYYKTIDNADDYVDYERVRESLQNEIPLNGTNGDVLKAVFPNVVIVHKIRENKREIVFSDECWNADYKGVE